MSKENQQQDVAVLLSAKNGLAYLTANDWALISDKATRVEFKADVRKLKALGLTESLEIGYRLTALGRTVVARASDAHAVGANSDEQ